MKIIKELPEMRVYNKQYEYKGIRCDICGGIIEPYDNSFNNYFVKYYAVMTGHRDWDNDSVDSIQHRDVCPKCLDKFVSDYFKNHESNTQYMNVETEVIRLGGKTWANSLGSSFEELEEKE